MAQPALKVVDMPPVDKDKSKAIDAAPTCAPKRSGARRTNGFLVARGIGA